MCVATTKALMSCAVTVQLNGAFVFALAQIELLKNVIQFNFPKRWL